MVGGNIVVPESWYYSVRDSLAAPLVASHDGSTSSFQPSILLRRRQLSVETCVDSLVESLATDLHAHLIYLGLDDLGVLARHFHDNTQDTDASTAKGTLSDLNITSGVGTTNQSLDMETTALGSHPDLAFFYFGVRSKKSAPIPDQQRNKAATKALISTLETQAERNVSSQQFGHTSQASIIIYVRDVNAFTKLDKGTRFLARLRDNLLSRNHGEQRHLLVASIFEAKYSRDDRTKLCQKLGFDAASTFDIPQQKLPHIKAAIRSHGKRNIQMNMVRLQQALENKLPLGMQEHVLRIFTFEDIPVDDKRFRFLRRRLLTEEKLQMAARQIVGRCWNQEAPSRDEVLRVLARLRRESADPREEKQPHLYNPFSTATRGRSRGAYPYGDLDGGQYEDELSDGSDTDTTIEDVEPKTPSPTPKPADCNQYEKLLLGQLVERSMFLRSVGDCYANVCTETLTTGYESVIIAEKDKEIMKTTLNLFKLRGTVATHPLLGQTQGRGALFYGPPGTGKTLTCRAIAKESGMSMLSIDAADVLGKWVGETEKHIRAAFTLAVKVYPCILFIDEVEALFGHRTSDQHSWERGMVTQFLKEMDGLCSHVKSPFVIVATNRPTDLDEAFLRRLPLKIPFPLPDMSQRISILRLNLSEEDLEDGCEIELLARQTEGYSGSDIRTLCGQAALVWAMEYTHSAEGVPLGSDGLRLKLNCRHFEDALSTMRPSVSRQFMQDIKRFEERHDQSSMKVSNSIVGSVGTTADCQLGNAWDAAEQTTVQG